MSSRTDERRSGSRRGFTLIELLVVIAIIATLAAVVAPSIFGNISTARTGTARTQVQVLSLALDNYRLDNDGYPTSEQGLQALRLRPTGGEAPVNWRGPYLRQEVPLDPWGRAYVYIVPGISNPTGFDLYSLGKDGRPGGSGEDEDVTSWNGPVRQ